VPREALLVPLIAFLIVLRGVAFADEIVEAFIVLCEERLRGHRVRKVILDEFLVLLAAELVQDGAHVRLGDAARREEPAGGPGPRRDDDAAGLELAQVGVVHYQTVDASFACVLLRHEDLVKNELADLLPRLGALHLEVDPLTVEVLKVVFLKLIEDVLDLSLFLVVVNLGRAQMPGGPRGVRVDPENRQVRVLYDPARPQIRPVAAYPTYLGPTSYPAR